MNVAIAHLADGLVFVSALNAIAAFGNFWCIRHLHARIKALELDASSQGQREESGR